MSIDYQFTINIRRQRIKMKVFLAIALFAAVCASTQGKNNDNIYLTYIKLTPFPCSRSELLHLQLQG